MTDAGTSYDSSFADGIPSPPGKITGEKHDIESGHEPSAAVAIVRSIEKKQRVEVEVEVEQKQKQLYHGSGNNKPSTPGHRPALAHLSDNKPPPSTSSNLGNDTDEFGKTKLSFDEVASTATTTSAAAAAGSGTTSSSSAATAAGAAVSKLSTAKAASIDRRSQHYFGKNINEKTALHLHQEIALYDSSTPNDLRSLDCTNHVPSTKITAKRLRTLEAMHLLHYKTMAFSSQSGPQPTTPLPLPSSSKVAENKAAYKLRSLGEVVSGDAVFTLFYCLDTGILVCKTSTMNFKSGNGKEYNLEKYSVYGVFGGCDYPLDYTNVPKHMIKTEANCSSNYVVINKEWLRTCQDKDIPFRRFLRPESVSYEKWTTTDVTPEGLERWEELKQCMKASFVCGVKSQGQLAVYNAVECEEEEGNTIQSGGKHYRQGSTELATYNSLSDYMGKNSNRKNSPKAKYYSSWGKTCEDPKRPTAYNTALKTSKPDPLFKDVRNEYPNGFLWKAQNNMLVWIRKH